jgi:threonine/homoserine/homoserine lactone efflux protein
VSSVVLRGFVLGFAIAASPGPIFFLCLRRTLVRGWLVGLISGLGVATADGFYAAVAAFGVGAVTSALVGERRWLAVIGGAVLVVLGIRTVLDRPKSGEAAPPSNVSGLGWAYLSTLGLTITNPATIIAFAALVAALGLGVGGGYVRPSVFVVGVFAGSATWWCALAGLAAGLRTRVSPTVVRSLSAFSGLAIVALGMLAIVSTFGVG